MARLARCSAAWTCSSTNGAGRSRGATVVARDAGWDDALNRIVAEVRRTGLTNDKACALGQFARVALRTPSIDYSGRFFGMSSAAVAAGKCSKSSIGLRQRPRLAARPDPRPGYLRVGAVMPPARPEGHSEVARRAPRAWRPDAADSGCDATAR
jgi:hypothetical protein